MPDTYIAEMGRAVGAPRPLRFAIAGPDLKEPVVHEIDAPFAVIGNSPACDVQVEKGRGVAFRHLCLQVIGNSVTCLDLFDVGHAKMQGPPSNDWLTPEHVVTFGAYHLRLLDDGWVKNVAEIPSPAEFKPRAQSSAHYGVLPMVDLELQNKAVQGKSWAINRVLTLMGRDDRCRIKFEDKDISKVHCSTLLTPTGLWAVDLLGRGGIHVDGTQVRCGPISEGTELKVGRYRMSPKYLDTASPVETAEQVATATGVDDLPSPVFMTKGHVVFIVQTHGNVLFVTPMGDARVFRYETIQLEGNKVLHLLDVRGFDHLVVDLGCVQLLDSIAISSIAGFCRMAKGKAAFCNATDTMKQTLGEMKLDSVWPMYPNRDAALAAVTG